MPIERNSMESFGASEEVGESSNSTRLPKSILSGKEVAVGDVVRLTVTDIGNDDFGVEYATETVEEKPTKGVASLAAEFD